MEMPSTKTVEAMAQGKFKDAFNLNPVESAIELFNQMCQEGAEPNEITYLGILKACTSALALKWGKAVHVYI
jgi:pentatricopeptide repeat protein